MNYREKLQPFDIIVVYNPKSWLHRIIYGVTKYKAGHVVLFTVNNEIYQATSTGIKRTDLRAYTEKHKIYICRYIPGLTEKQKTEILRFCMISAGKKYAYLQLLMMLIKYIFRLKRVPDVSREAMICSEFVASAFEAADIDLTWKPSWEVTPADIMCSPKLWRIECQ